MRTDIFYGGGGYFGPWECWAIGDGGFGCGIVTLGECRSRAF